MLDQRVIAMDEITAITPFWQRIQFPLHDWEVDAGRSRLAEDDGCPEVFERRRLEPGDLTTAATRKKRAPSRPLKKKRA